MGDHGSAGHDTIHHVALPADWAHARDSGEYRVSTRGRTLDDVGFVHCAHDDQVAGVLARFYADVDGPLLLLSIDPSRLAASVVEEPPAPGVAELFPHVYGPIPVTAVTRVRRLDPPHGTLPDMPD